MVVVVPKPVPIVCDGWLTVVIACVQLVVMVLVLELVPLALEGLAVAVGVLEPMPIAFDGRLTVCIGLAVAVGVLEPAPITIDGWLMVVIVWVGLVAWCWWWNRRQSHAMSG